MDLTSDVTCGQMRNSCKGGPYCRKSPCWSKGVVLRSVIEGFAFAGGAAGGRCRWRTDRASVGERRLVGGKRETWERSPVILHRCNYLSSSF